VSVDWLLTGLGLFLFESDIERKRKTRINVGARQSRLNDGQRDQLGFLSSPTTEAVIAVAKLGASTGRFERRSFVDGDLQGSFSVFSGIRHVIANVLDQP
jgi:hypothetical protein